jgi:hypothetical protein
MATALVVLTIVKIGLSFVRWNVKGLVVAEGGVTESPTMMAVAVRGTPPVR